MAKRRGNGEGNIRQRPNGLWEARVTVSYGVDGKQVRKSIYGPTQAAVIEERNKFLSRLATGPAADSGKLNLANYLSRWLENTVEPTVRPGTYSNYERSVRLEISPRLGGILLNKLSAFHIEQFYGQMRREGRSPHAQQMAAKVLTLALGHAARTHLIPYNPSTGIRKPKAPESEMQVLNDEEMQRFLEAAKGHRLEALFVLALTSGMREGELLGLRWVDVDWKGAAINVQRALDRDGHLTEPKSRAARRRIELPQGTLAALREHRKQQLADGAAGALIFSDRAGNPLRKSNFIRRDFKPLLKKADLPDIRFHDIRHTHASWLLRNGENVKTIQERLGHAKVELTLRVYSHLLPGIQRQAADKLDALFAHDPAAPEPINPRHRSTRG